MPGDPYVGPLDSIIVLSLFGLSGLALVPGGILFVIFLVEGGGWTRGILGAFLLAVGGLLFVLAAHRHLGALDGPQQLRTGERADQIEQKGLAYHQPQFTGNKGRNPLAP